MNKHISFILFLQLTSFLFAQKINVDNEVVKMVANGKYLLSVNKYAEASETFEIALLRPFNTLTTTTTYLSGLSSYYMKDWVNAQYRFHQLITGYPKSKYVAEAQYHLSLVEMNSNSVNTKATGLERMYALSEVNKEIPYAVMVEAKQASKMFAFNYLPADAVAIYYKKAPSNQVMELMEAMCYRYVRENNKNEAERIYQNHLSAGNSKSSFVENLLKNAANLSNATGVSAPIVTIAVMLPFFTPEDAIGIDTLVEIPEESTIALTLFEGFMEGMNAYSDIAKKKFFIKVLDTKRDNYMVQRQLEELERFQPDIIIGEVYNKQSRLIAEWVSEHHVTQFIPLSPTKSLIEERQNVFLLNPSTITHGYKMAEYAYNDLGLRKVTVWTDGTTSSSELANAFAARFQVMGGTPIISLVDSVYAMAQPQILEGKDKFSGVEGMYIPIDNEETVGLILSLIEVNRYPLKVMALPDIEAYEQISRDLKEICGIYYTSTYTPQLESEGYQTFVDSHYLNYNSPPMEYHIRGYDMGQYISQVCDDYRGGDFNQFIRDYVPVYGIHIDYDFNREQDNQGLRIQQYTVEGIVRVK